VGRELELYRKSKNISEDLKEKKRCWTLHYQDELSFHMDVVPCIPANEERIQKIFKSLRADRADEVLAKSSSATTISITDTTRENFSVIDDEWEISNPEGYCTWFQSEMKKTIHDDTILKTAMEAQVDEIPTYKRKTILQRVIKLLKRHRDVYYINNSDSKPISIIITTLSARAYSGEKDFSTALDNILEKMPTLVRSTIPRIPNPTDPEEDFSDKWATPEGKALKLEENFFNWVRMAKRDFNALFKLTKAGDMERFIKDNFYESIHGDTIKDTLSYFAPLTATQSKTVNIKENSPKPWLITRE
jgi:hypothetical protein